MGNKAGDNKAGGNGNCEVGHPKGNKAGCHKAGGNAGGNGNFEVGHHLGATRLGATRLGATRLGATLGATVTLKSNKNYGIRRTCPGGNKAGGNKAGGNAGANGNFEVKQALWNSFSIGWSNKA